MLTRSVAALIGISFASVSTTYAPAPNIEQLDAAAADAQSRLIEDIEEWEIADEEGGDGGEAVKVPRVQQMRADKDFEQGMRRADKAEAKGRRRGGGGSGRGGFGGRGRGPSYGGNAHNDFPPLQPSMEGPGVTQFHSVNEKRQREKAANGSSQGSYPAPQPRGGKKENVALSEHMKNRLKILDDEDDDYFTI